MCSALFVWYNSLLSFNSSVFVQVYLIYKLSCCWVVTMKIWNFNLGEDYELTSVESDFWTAKRYFLETGLDFTQSNSKNSGKLWVYSLPENYMVEGWHDYGVLGKAVEMYETFGKRPNLRVWCTHKNGKVSSCTW